MHKTLKPFADTKPKALFKSALANQNNFDLIIAQKIGLFNLQNLFSTSNSNNDSLEFLVGEETIKVSGFQWSIYSITSNTIELKADFSTTNPEFQLGKSFLIVSLDIFKLLNIDEKIFFKIFSHFDSNDVLFCNILQKNFEKALIQNKSTIKSTFFRDSADSLPFAHSKVTTSVYFCKVNSENILDSYLCLGQMFDDRKPPVEANFPVAEMNKNQPVIIYLSPYLYLKLGLYQKLHQAYPNINIHFSDKGDEISLENIPLDRQDIANRMKESVENILDAKITKLSFALKNSNLSVEYATDIHVRHNSKLPFIFLIPIPIPIPNNYRIKSTSKSFFELWANNNKVDIREIEALKQNFTEKIADNKTIDEIFNKIESITQDVVSFVIRYVLPLAIDLYFGLGLLAGAVLFSVFDTLANLFDEACENSKIREKIQELATFKALQLSFENLIPFTIQSFMIQNFKVDGGIVISGKAIKTYLAKGDCLLPGEFIMNSLGYTLIFQTDGNLVLYNNSESFESKNVIWCSDNSNKFKTYKKGGEEVVFEKNGNLVMYKNNRKEIVWNSLTASPNAEFLFICNEKICISKLNSLKSNELNAKMIINKMKHDLEYDIRYFDLDRIFYYI